MGKQATTTAPSVDPPQFELLDLDRLHPSPANPRHDIGDVGELAASIKELGIIEPLIVTPNGDGFILVAGHRRHAAAVRAGVRQAPCVVRPGLDEKAQAEIRVVENLHRQDLTPLEEAEAFKALIDLGYSQRALEKKISRSQAHISRRLSLLKLPEKARAAVDTGDITVEQGAALAKVEPKAVEELFKKGQPASWQIQEAVRKQEVAERKEAGLEELRASGATILESPPAGYHHRLGRNWGVLRDLDLDSHRTEPCHAGAVTHSGEIEWFCTHPERHQPDGASAIKLPAETEDEDDEPAPEDPAEKERWEAARAARAAVEAERDERHARRTVAIESRRAFAATAIADVDAAGAVELTALLYAYCYYVEEPFDVRTAAFLGLEKDTFNNTPADEQIKAYAAKGSRNCARAVAGAAACLFEAMVAPSSYSLGDEHVRLHEEDDVAAARVWFAWLMERGYELSDHDRELLPEPEPPAEPQPDDAVAWYDDPEEGPRWVDESEAAAIADVDADRLHVMEGNPSVREVEELAAAELPTITVTLRKSGKRWTVTCSACGDVGNNTTEEYGNEAGALHLAGHGSVDEVSA